MLGGSSDRERFAAKLAHTHPDLNVWISSGTSQAARIFESAHVSPDRLYFDTRATDTVTNFTTVVGDFKRRGIQHVYILTSDYHMPRAQAIATVVFGSQGITYTPVRVPGDRPRESNLRILRDVGRSLIWLMTGRTGASWRSRTDLSIKTAHKLR